MISTTTPNNTTVIDSAMAASLLRRDHAHIVGDSPTEGEPGPPLIPGTAGSMLVAHPIQKVMRVHPVSQVFPGAHGSVPLPGEKRDAYEDCQRHHEADR